MLGSVVNPRRHVELNEGGQKQIIRQYLSANGDGTGSATFTGNYSGQDATPYIQAPAGTIYRLTSVIVSILDTGNDGFAPNDYGYDPSGIGPGWSMQALTGAAPGTVLHDYTHITNTRNSYLGFNNGAELYLNIQFPNDTQTALVSEYSLIAANQALRLDGDLSERLVVTLSADYRALQAHSWFVHGYIE